MTESSTWRLNSRENLTTLTTVLKRNLRYLIDYFNIIVVYVHQSQYELFLLMWLVLMLLNRKLSPLLFGLVNFLFVDNLNELIDGLIQEIGQ